ncbi:hypothetical protein PSAC2689_10703 [Paraburkholderia sacchari]
MWLCLAAQRRTRDRLRPTARSLASNPLNVLRTARRVVRALGIAAGWWGQGFVGLSAAAKTAQFGLTAGLRHMFRAPGSRVQGPRRCRLARSRADFVVPCSGRRA